MERRKAAHKKGRRHGGIREWMDMGERNKEGEKDGGNKEKNNKANMNNLRE